MEYTHLNDMAGYREPTWEECQKVRQYVLYIKKRDNLMYIFWSAFAALVFLAGVCEIITATSEEPIRMLVLYGIFTVLAGAGFIACRKGIKNNHALCDCIEDRHFQIMDIRAYEADPAGGNEGPGGSIRFYNAKGQYCVQWMPVDSLSCKEWKEYPDKPFYLVKCDYGGKYPYREAFSERKFTLIRKAP